MNKTTEHSPAQEQKTPAGTNQTPANGEAGGL